MPWDNTTKIMTAPLNINSDGDIQQASGVSSGELGYCFVHGKWNKNAKYKPVKSSKISPMTEADLKALNYGLVIPKYTDMDSLMAGITAGEGWAYDQPDGSTGEVYRKYDLTNPSDGLATGYRGNANCFLETVDLPSIYTQGGGGLEGGIPVAANINTGTNLIAGSVAISDLTDINGDNISLGDMYLGVLLVKGTSCYYLTSSSTLGSQTHVLDLTIPSSDADGLATGAWNAYVFLAATRCVSAVTNAGTINGTYLRGGAYALPGVGKRSITIQAAATLASCSIRNGDDGLALTLGPGRFTLAFDISYKASSSTTYIYATYKVYGGSTYGAKDTLLGTSPEITLRCSTTLQYHSVSETFRTSFPNYVTVELTYRVGSSQTVYTAPDASAPMPQD